jgi:hypothetical protein
LCVTVASFACLVVKCNLLIVLFFSLTTAIPVVLNLDGEGNCK